MNRCLPYRVPDALDAARRFAVHLGLSQVDSWGGNGGTGVVLAAAYPELRSPAGPAGTPVMIGSER